MAPSRWTSAFTSRAVPPTPSRSTSARGSPSGSAKLVSHYTTKGGRGGTCLPYKPSGYGMLPFPRSLLAGFLRVPSFLLVLVRWGVLPAVEVVGSRAHCVLFSVQVSLEAIGHDDGFIVACEILDQARRCLDDIRVQPQNPGSSRSKRSEEDAVPGFTHSSPAVLLDI